MSFSSLLYEIKVKHYNVFPDGSLVKNPPANAGAEGSIPRSGRSLKKEVATHCNILAWEMDRGAWWATVQGLAKELDTTKCLNNNKML